MKEAEEALDGTAKPADELVAPTKPVEVKDPSKLDDNEKKAVEKAVRDANPTLPADAKVTVADDGSVTVTDKDGKEIGKLKPEQTVKGVLNTPTKVAVKDPENLTDEEKAAVEEAVKKANPDLPADATIEVGNDGTVTVTDKDGNEIGAIPADKTVKGVLNAPTEPVEVKDPENLTDEEKDAVEKAVKDANPNLPEGAKVTVGDDGKVTVTDKDGNEIGTIPAKQAVKKAVDKTGLEAEVAKKDATTASDKYKYADAAKKKAYDDALAKAKEVLNNPEASQAEVDAAKEALEKAADELNGKATDKSKLEAEVAKKDATKASDKYKYADAAKKKAYDDALEKAKEVLNNPKASQAQVDAALDALQKAESALNGTKPSDDGTTPSYPSYPSYPSNPQTPGTTTENRVSGNDRIQTAIEISKKYFGHADTVIVVDSNNYADAITASVLSKILKAPILLTDTHKLDARVGAEIERLGAKDVIIVGGHNSVADSVKGELKAYDEDSVERIWGNDRYETSAQVARRIVGITGKKGHAVIASGEVFADALAVGPYAAQQGYPILLVQAKNIPTSINKALKDLGIKNVTIAGGINTVSKSLENPLPNVVERLQGKSRYETAIAIAQSKFPQAKEAFLVNGEQWMDALVIAPVGGIMSKPILLTPSNNAPQSLKDYLIKSEIERLTAVGGNRMVSEQVLKELTKK